MSTLPPVSWIVEVLSRKDLPRAPVTQSEELKAEQGHYVAADRLEPFVEKVRHLLEGSKEQGWSAEKRASVRTILANTLLAMGEQSGESQQLEEAVAAYRAALEERTWEREPLEWARTQYKLGHVLWVLGDRKQSSSLRCEALHSHTLVWGVLSEAGEQGAGHVAQDIRKESEFLRSNPGSQGLEGCLKTYGKAMARRIATLERRK